MEGCYQFKHVVTQYNIGTRYDTQSYEKWQRIQLSRLVSTGVAGMGKKGLQVCVHTFMILKQIMVIQNWTI